MITNRENRVKVLSSAGVPAGFLNALEKSETVSDFQAMIRFPDAAYHYLPTIENSYAFLVEQAITPICDDGAETFYLHLAHPTKTRFIACALEYSEVLEDFGSNFNALLAHLLIQLYEFSEKPINELADIGLGLGFKNAALLFSALEQATREGTRATFESEAMWRKKYLPVILSDKNLPTSSKP